MTQKQAVNQWRTGAKEAIETAKILLTGGKFTHALFFCHLAAEKILKASYIAEKDKDPPKTHELMEIALQLSQQWSEEEKGELGKLSTFAVAARYDELELLNDGTDPAESVQWWITTVEKYFNRFSS